MRFRPAIKFALVTLSFAAAACGGGEKPKTADSAQAPAVAPAPDAGADTSKPAGAAVGGLNGETEYIVCSTCHQPDGKGLPGVYPPLAGSEYVNGDPATPIAIILHGLQGEVTVAGKTFNAMMMPWAQLSDAQIAAILTYERSSWGNSAAAVTPEQVAKVRAATTGRTTPWTIAELKAAKLD